jgi:hypothetical protein
MMAHQKKQITISRVIKMKKVLKIVLDFSLVLTAITAMVWMIQDLSKKEDANTRLIKLHDQIKFEKCLAKNDLSIDCKL